MWRRVNGSISVRAVVRRAVGAYFRRPFELLLASACLAASIAVLDRAGVGVIFASRIAVAIAELAVLTPFTGVVVHAAADIIDAGRRRSPDQLVRAVMPMFGKLMLVGSVAGFAVGFLFSIATTIAFILAVGGVLSVGVSTGSVIGFATIGLIVFFAPGVLLLTIWSVIAPVVVLEQPGRLRALRRSRRLVRGNRLRVLGMIVISVVPLTIAARVIELAGARDGSGSGLIATLLATTLFAPILVLLSTALYYELRRVEGAGASEAAMAPSPAG
jgi:hypothetical protein